MITLSSIKGEFLNQYSLKSSATKEKYKKDIELFCDMAVIEDLQDLNNLSNVQVERFMDYARSRQWNSNTINQRIVSMKIFTKWCLDRGYIVNDYLRTVKLIKVQNNVHFTPSMDDCEKLLEYIRQHTRKRRLYLMVKLMLNTALRKNEICNLKIKDLDTESFTIKVMGKGNKIVEQPIPADLVVELVKYINKERQKTMNKYIALGGKDKGYLFLSGVGNDATSEKRDLTNGCKVSDVSFWAQIKRYAKLAKIQNADKFTVHCLRRASGTDLYNRTGDIKLVSEFLRHSNTSTTENHYVAFDRNRISEAVNNRYNESKNVAMKGKSAVTGLTDNEERQLYELLKKKFGG